MFDKLSLTFFYSFFLFFGIYGYFYASLNDSLSFKFIFFLLLISSYRLFNCRFEIKKIFYFILFSFLYLILISNLLPPSSYIKLSFTVHSLSFLFLSFLILSAYSYISFFEKKNIIIVFFISIFFISVISILNFYKIFDKSIFDIFENIPVVKSKWNTKYYSYWLVFLMWASFSLSVSRGFSNKILSFLMSLLCVWAVFLTDAESAQLAIVVSVFFFIILSLERNRYKKYFFSIPFILFLVVPVLWVISPPVMGILKRYEFLHEIASQIDGVYLRIELYDGVADLIRKKIVTGYGFGSGYNIPVDTTICSFGGGRLPGGHPHNIVFMALLEQGVFGYCWLVVVMFLLFSFTCKRILHRPEFPSFSALIISAMIIFSFSFDVWSGDVILLYVMLALLTRIIIVGSVSCSGTEDKAVFFHSKNAFLVIMVGGTIAYLLNFIFFSGQINF